MKATNIEKHNQRLELQTMSEVVSAMAYRLEDLATGGGKLAELANELHDMYRTLSDWCEEQNRRDPDRRTAQQIDEVEPDLYDWQQGYI